MEPKLFLVGVREGPRDRFVQSAAPPRMGESHVLLSETLVPHAFQAVEFSREGGDSILIVDDEFDMLESLQGLMHLLLPGHHILVAHNACEALQILRRERVRLVLADYRMPSMTGIEMFREMERQHILVPAFLLTAFADSNLEVEARKVGLVKGFFKKPIEPHALIEAAMKYCAPAPESRGGKP